MKAIKFLLVLILIASCTEGSENNSHILGTYEGSGTYSEQNQWSSYIENSSKEMRIDVYAGLKATVRSGSAKGMTFYFKEAPNALVVDERFEKDGYEVHMKISLFDWGDARKPYISFRENGIILEEKTNLEYGEEYLYEFTHYGEIRKL